MNCISFAFVALVFTPQCLGTFSGNILEGKPSKQSSIHTLTASHSQSANDGDFETKSATALEPNPYWEADLGGFYNVTTITVTSASGYANLLKEAVIEIATTSISTCPGSTNTFRCGQWPDEHLEEVSITFNCTYQAVRYVRIRREITHHLIIAEVAAEGVPSILPGKLHYEKLISKKVTTPIKSLSVGKVTECGTMCTRYQPCIAFSFSNNRKPNCLLAIDTSMATDAEWNGYKFSECMTMPITCPPIG